MRGTPGIVEIPYYDSRTGQFPAAYDLEATIYGPLCVVEDVATGRHAIAHTATGQTLYSCDSRKAMLRAARRLAGATEIRTYLLAHQTRHSFEDDPTWPEMARRIKGVIGGALLATLEVRGQ